MGPTISYLSVHVVSSAEVSWLLRLIPWYIPPQVLMGRVSQMFLNI
jgi:hypothetical protein